jgi:hypothetical protein
MMLGQMALQGTMYGPNKSAVLLGSLTPEAVDDLVEPSQFRRSFVQHLSYAQLPCFRPAAATPRRECDPEIRFRVRAPARARRSQPVNGVTRKWRFGTVVKQTTRDIRWAK